MAVISATGVGQAQWVSITAIMGKNTGSNISVVPQGAPALRFKSVQQGESLLTAGGTSDFQNIYQADIQYASKDGGPFPVQLAYPFGVTYSGYLVRKDSGIKTPADIKPGLRVSDLTTSPGIKTKQIPALYAWAKVDPSTITWVPFGNYDATLQAVKDGKSDIAFAFTSSPKTLEVSDQCTLIALDPAKDAAAAQRFLDVWTVASFMVVQEGPPGFIGVPSNGGLTGISTREANDTALIYNIAKWLDANYSQYQDAHPQNKYMTFDNMVIMANTFFVPMHPGAIQYLKEKGKWTAANDARQKANIDLQNAWIAGYKDAMAKAAAANIPVDAANKDWLAFWAKYQTDNASKLPVVRNYLGLP